MIGRAKAYVGMPHISPQRWTAFPSAVSVSEGLPPLGSAPMGTNITQVFLLPIEGHLPWVLFVPLKGCLP